MAEMAIVWAVRKHENEMKLEEAEIERHKRFAENRGAVYWDVKWLCREKVSTGYLYVSDEKAITWKVKIEEIITLDELKDRREKAQTYVPNWRMQCLTGLENGEPHPTSPTWIKIKEFIRLQNPISPRMMKKWKNKEPINSDYVRRGVYVLDEDWE